MSRVYPPTRDGKAAMWRETRARARAHGDAGMARMASVELARLGELETTQDTTLLETVTPVAPRRGRKPKPRCEHGQIADRCVDCDPDLAA
jgi:hypothetical protein